MDTTENWKLAWQAYKMKCETSFLVRQGLVACGLVQDIDFENIYRKPEFVSEHEGRAAYLYCVIMLWQSFNDLIEPFGGDYKTMPKDDKERVEHRLHFSSVDPALVFFLLAHDIGEIRCGDTLDDGSIMHELTRSEEAMTMDELFNRLPPSLLSYFRELRLAFEGYDADSNVNAAFIKAVEKAEAIAFQLFLHEKGFDGDITLKKPPSERDLLYAEVLGTNTAADVWALHYRVAVKDIDPDILRPVTTFLQTAFLESYNCLPECMTIDISTLNVET